MPCGMAHIADQNIMFTLKQLKQQRGKKKLFFYILFSKALYDDA